MTRPWVSVISCVLLNGCISPAPLPPPGTETKAEKSDLHYRAFVQDVPHAINAAGRDYGESIAEWRERLVRHSITNPFFWTMTAGLGVMALALATIAHQRNQRERQEWIAAELLAQYHNAWVYANRQAQEAITRHNSFVEQANRASEAAELLSINVAASKTEPERESKPSPGTVFLKGNLRPRSDIQAAGEPRSGQKPRNLRQPEPDLLAQIHTLQEQLDASCERERNLERELKKGSRTPAPEQKLNA